MDEAQTRGHKLPLPHLLLGVWNLAVFAGWCILPFFAAGVGWWPGWAHLAAVALAFGTHRTFVTRHNPALSAARRRIGEGTPAWDLAWNALFWPLLASTAVVGALEARGGTPLPWTLWPAGLLVLAAGFAASAWAMSVNPHFEGTVRIQAERDHSVVEAGPYRLLRHPGYLGLVLWALATPLLVLSRWAFVPAVATALWIVLRTWLEDAFLRRGLPGYAGYAGRVRFRLLPGVW